MIRYNLCYKENCSEYFVQHLYSPGSMKFYEHFHCYLRVYLLHCIAHINESANDHHILALEY